MNRRCWHFWTARAPWKSMRRWSNSACPWAPFTLWDMVGLDVGLHRPAHPRGGLRIALPFRNCWKASWTRECSRQKAPSKRHDYSSGGKKPSKEVERFIKDWREGRTCRATWPSPPGRSWPYRSERPCGFSPREASPRPTTSIPGWCTARTSLPWGPLHYAENVGWEAVNDLLCSLACEYGPDRFTAPSMMEDSSRATARSKLQLRRGCRRCCRHDDQQPSHEHAGP